MSTREIVKKRGFTTAEKWIIWGVFCLLVGLSSHISAFFGLLILSAGGVLARRGWRARAAAPLLAGGLLIVAGIGLALFGHRIF